MANAIQPEWIDDDCWKAITTAQEYNRIASEQWGIMQNAIDVARANYQEGIESARLAADAAHASWIASFKRSA